MVEFEFKSEYIVKILVTEQKKRDICQTCNPLYSQHKPSPVIRIMNLSAMNANVWKAGGAETIFNILY